MNRTNKLLGKQSIDQVPPSRDLGALPRLDWVSKHKIDIDDRYQRQVGQTGAKHVNNILRNFRWRNFQVLTLTPKAERFFAIDGQHRWIAAMKHPRVDLLPCCILEELDVAESARVFEALNGARLGISGLSRFHTALAAGDPMAMKLDYLCGEAGVSIPRNQPQGPLPPLSLIGLGTLKKMLPKGDGTIIAALSAMAEAWPARPNGFRSTHVYAVVSLVAKAGPDLDKQVLGSVLAMWEEHSELVTAYSTRGESGGIIERIMADQMWAKYEQRVKFFQGR